VNQLLSEFKHIVRIASVDIDGSKKLVYGLIKVKGVDITFAKAVVYAAGLNPESRIGALTESQIEKIEEIMMNPIKYGVPRWIVNRPNEFESGKDRHLIGADLALKIKTDIDLMQKTKSWKGLRHSLGLTVRGQKTRTTGRFGRAVGVKTKVLIAAAVAAARAKEGAPGAPAAPAGTAAPAPSTPGTPAKPAAAEAPKKKEEAAGKEKK
jgi:small subunit ribosomal protein S13